MIKITIQIHPSCGSASEPTAFLLDKGSVMSDKMPSGTLCGMILTMQTQEHPPFEALLYPDDPQDMITEAFLMGVRNS